MLYEALGFALPEFAHIPMILGSDHTRLSKRHGATSVTQYRDEGYLPEALVNYLALLGWSYDGSQQIFPPAELQEKFSLDKVSKNPAVFDPAKLVWMNGHYIKEAAPERLAELALPFLQSAGYVALPPRPEEMERVQAVVVLLQDRLKLLSQVAEFGDYFFTDAFLISEEAQAKYWSQPHVPAALAQLGERLQAMTDFSEAELERVVRGLADELGLKAAALIHPLRVALTGRMVSPGIFAVMALLGRDKVVERIERALPMVKTVNNSK